MKTDGRQPQSAAIPLNQLDKMFYALELLGYLPMARIHFELSGGDLDIELLRQAYAIEIKRRPVLNALINDTGSGPGWQVRWVPQDHFDHLTAVSACDFSSLPPEVAEKRFKEIQFDPFSTYRSHKNAPFSIVVCKLPNQQSRLLAFFHHAVADAYGYGLILGDLFATYNSLKDGHVLNSISHQAPHSISSLLPKSRWKCVQGLLSTLIILVREFMRNQDQSPVKLITGKSSFLGTTGAVQRAVDREKLSRYLAAAKRAAVTLNDFLVTSQIAAIDRWKRQKNEPCNVITMQVHKNMRATDCALQEIANRFSTYIISTQPRHRADLKALLQHIRKEREKAQQRKTAEKTLCLLSMLDTRIAARTLHRWGHVIFNNPQIGDSCQVTNVGRLWMGPDNKPTLSRIGDAELTACYMAGPPIPSIGCYTSFVTYNHRLFITFNYFNWTMTDTEAHAFIDLFQATLEDLAGAIG